MAEGARLESVFRGNSNVGSNPTLSASIQPNFLIPLIKYRKYAFYCHFPFVALVAIFALIPPFTLKMHDKAGSARQRNSGIESPCGNHPRSNRTRLGI